MQDDVLEFVDRRFKKDCNWLDGNCYYFAVILKDRFPNGRIWYDVVPGHFLFECNGKYYDFSGCVDEQHVVYAIPWDEMEQYDLFEKDRIVRDCVL